MKVLIIDDDLSILESIKMAMEIENHKVDILSAGEEAVRIAKETKPDLIILDYLLSGTDGCFITRRLKQNPATKKIPIIMFSAHPQAQKLAQNAGVDEFIAKPFDLDELFTKMHNLVYQ